MLSNRKGENSSLPEREGPYKCVGGVQAEREKAVWRVSADHRMQRAPPHSHSAKYALRSY